MDPLGDPLTTRPIQTGWEFPMEPYPSGQFGFIDDPDRQFGIGSVWTRIRTQSDGPEPLLTLVGTCKIAQTVYDSIQYVFKCCSVLSGCRPHVFSCSYIIKLLHNRCLCVLNSPLCHSGFSLHIILDLFFFLFDAWKVHWLCFLHSKVRFRS